MSGLLALLDDVAALAKLAAATLDDIAAHSVKAGTKAAGVVVDDAAVTPRYVTGLASERELPIIRRIAWGSLKNKLLILLPLAMVLTVFLPQAVTPLLMLGGLYLCLEGYEKVHHWVSHEKPVTLAEHAASTANPQALEDERVAGAIRTDFILSAEIMAITLAATTVPDLWTKAAVLTAVAVGITAVVYGMVALIVKADDFGLYLAQRGGVLTSAVGRALVRGMPGFLSVLSTVGTIAMLWVGGGILLHGLAEFGIHTPEHILSETAAMLNDAMPAMGGFAGWLVHALGAAVVGLAAGAVTAVLVAMVTPLMRAFRPQS